MGNLISFYTIVVVNKYGEYKISHFRNYEQAKRSFHNNINDLKDLADEQMEIYTLKGGNMEWGPGLIDHSRVILHVN